MKNLIKKNIIFLFIFIIVVSSCSFSKKIQPNEESLRIRINEFYYYFQTENYEKFLDFMMKKPVMSKRDAAKYLRDYFRFKIVSFKIDSITPHGELDAKVKMINTYMQDKEYIVEHVDCWVFKNGNWYISDFGRSPDWECEFNE